jgi:RecB family exonuclease
MRNVVKVQGQLGLEGIPDKLVRVTPARLVNWESCPRRYRMTYVDRPAPARSRAWAHSTLGAVVHNALRAFFELPRGQRTAERAVALLRRYWKSDGFAHDEQAAEYRERAAMWLSDYVAGGDCDDEPVAVERWVSAPVGTIIAEGRVDRVDHRDGELVVVDYKTGRHALSADAARGSLALALYALATGKALHQPCRRVELHHLPSRQVVSWEHTEETFAEQRDRAERLAAQLQAATDVVAEGRASEAERDEWFPARPGRHCATCDFRVHCPEGQRASEPLRSWALLGE